MGAACDVTPGIDLRHGWYSPLINLPRFLFDLTIESITSYRRHCSIQNHPPVMNVPKFNEREKALEDEYIRKREL